MNNDGPRGGRAVEGSQTKRSTTAEQNSDAKSTAENGPRGGRDTAADAGPRGGRSVSEKKDSSDEASGPRGEEIPSLLPMAQEEVGMWETKIQGRKESGQLKTMVPGEVDQCYSVHGVAGL